MKSRDRYRNSGTHARTNRIGWLRQITRMLRHRRMPLFWGMAVAALLVPWLVSVGARLPYAGPGADQTLDDCVVDSVYDGDTMTVRCSGREVKVRLYCIDAPEMDQKPWGRQSRDHLRSITPDTVRIQVRDTDRYGRTVGEVLDGERNLNLAMVRAGWAVEYERYCEVPGYGAAERRAREAGRGVWREPGLQRRPWEWRTRGEGLAVGREPSFDRVGQ